MNNNQFTQQVTLQQFTPQLSEPLPSLQNRYAGVGMRGRGLGSFGQMMGGFGGQDGMLFNVNDMGGYGGFGRGFSSFNPMMGGYGGYGGFGRFSPMMGGFGPMMGGYGGFGGFNPMMGAGLGSFGGYGGMGGYGRYGGFNPMMGYRDQRPPEYVPAALGPDPAGRQSNDPYYGTGGPGLGLKEISADRQYPLFDRQYQQKLGIENKIQGELNNAFNAARSRGLSLLDAAKEQDKLDAELRARYGAGSRMFVNTPLSTQPFNPYTENR